MLGSLNMHNSNLTVSNTNSIIALQGNFSADNSSSLNLGMGATMLLQGSFSNAITNQANFTASSATLQVIGPGQNSLEVAGLDLGPITPSNGNFGFGSLVVGQLNSPATLELVDLVDNGDRADGPEALYLFGSGGSNGLSLLDGSTLVLNHLDAYDDIGGSWVSLQAVLGNNNQVAFDGGYLAQQAVPEPSTWALLAAAAGFMLYFGKPGSTRLGRRVRLQSGA